MVVGTSPMALGHWLTLKGYEPPDRKSYEFQVALGVRT